MRLTVSPEIAESIRELHELGWSQRRIAKRHEVSTTTVHRIVRDHWHPVEEHDDPFWELKLRAERCPGCGGLVYDWPCRACEIRAMIARDAQQLRRAA